MGVSRITETPEYYREQARKRMQERQESWERSDTDGFLSQWAMQIAADRYELMAKIAENDGKWEFQALFDLNGELIAAKSFEGRYGLTWGILESDDPKSRFASYFSPSNARDEKRRRANDAKKGYYVGRVKARAVVMDGNPRAYPEWAGGFSRDVEIVDNGQ